MNSDWGLSPETLNSCQNHRFFDPCDLDIWQNTPKISRAHLLYRFKFCALFRNHLWIQTRVTVRKQPNWGKKNDHCDFDLWPRPFAWTSLLLIVLTPENFMMIRLKAHYEKMCERKRDKQTELFLELLVTAKNNRVLMRFAYSIFGRYMWSSFHCDNFAYIHINALRLQYTPY